MTPNILIHDSSLSWLGTDIPIKSGAVKLVYVSKMPAFKLTPNRTNNVIIKNALILNNIYNIFNLRNTEVAICIKLVLLNRIDDLNHYLGTRFYTKPS